MRAALPFICLNVLAGGLTLYGLADLRYEGWAIGEFCGLLLLQSLVAIQIAMFAVYLMPNQARRPGQCLQPSYADEASPLSRLVCGPPLQLCWESLLGSMLAALCPCSSVSEYHLLVAMTCKTHNTFWA